MKERVTVSFDEESYYLDGEYWCGWDDFGEQMAEYINKLLDEEQQAFITVGKQLSTINSRFREYLKSQGYTYEQIRAILWNFAPYHSMYRQMMPKQHTRKGKKYFFKEKH